MAAVIHGLRCPFGNRQFVRLRLGILPQELRQRNRRDRLMWLARLAQLFFYRLPIVLFYGDNDLVR
jgi:hypothetical protein